MQSQQITDHVKLIQYKVCRINYLKFQVHIISRHYWGVRGPIAEQHPDLKKTIIFCDMEQEDLILYFLICEPL